MPRSLFPILAILLIFSSFAYANQPDTLQLEEVSVSVIPFQDNNDKATAGFFTVAVSESGIKQVVNIAEIINLAPGIFMASGTYNTNRLVIRGIGSRTPYGSNRIRVYLDDIPLTSGDGISAVEDIDASSLGNIEIVKGPASALYGSGLGGILKLSSRYPENQGLSVYQSNEYGSFNTWKNSFSVGFKRDKLVLTAGYSRSYTEGFRENSNYFRNNLFLSGHYFGIRTHISGTFHFVDLYSEIPSSLNEEDFTSAPWKASGNWLAAAGFEEYRKAMLGVSFKTSLSERFQNHLVIYSKYGDPYERRPFNILDERSFTHGIRESVNYQVSSLSLSAGIEYYNEYFNWQIYETVTGGQGLMLTDSKERRQYLNGFLHAQFKPTKNLVIDAGINYNLLSYALSTQFESDSADHSGVYAYDPILSPRIGLNYSYLQDHFLYGSVGHGFSPPSLEETLLPEGSVNTELKPETGWNFEVGERGSFLAGSVSYDLTLYAVYLENLLVTERIAEDQFTGVNAGTVLNAGLEFQGKARLLHSGGDTQKILDLSMGLTLSNNRFLDFTDDGVTYDGNHLPGIPGNIFQSILSGKIGDFRSQLQYRYTGDQWMDDANSISYGDYHLVNFHVSWDYRFGSFPFGLEISAGIKNLLNTSYASMILVNAPSFGGNSPRYYYPGMPRQFHVGIAFHIQ